MATPTGSVIVGAGIAGVSAAAAMRSGGYEGPIILIGDEPELPYRRPPVSKEIIRGEKTADEIRIKKPQWYVDNDIELRTDVHVRAVDPGEHAVELAAGAPLRYDQLLLATGGRARTFGNGRGFRTLRTLGDVPALKDELRFGQPIIVVGAGLIGSEIAASARTLGCEVTLLEAARLPLPHLLPPAIAQMYLELHRAAGTNLHTDVMVTEIAERGEETVVTAADGRSWSAPIVVVAVGMVPATELAQAAGLSVDNGIVVDASGRTSAPGIFAAGDVANQPNAVLGGRHRVEHWQGAQNHGTAAGKAMAGQQVVFGEVPWCWSDQYGQTLQVTGWPAADDELVVRGSLESLDFCAFFLRAGAMTGAVSLTRPGDIRAARKLIAARSPINAGMLVDDSTPVAQSAAV